MNIKRWKGLLWLASFSVGGYLAWYVSDFLRRKPELAQEVSDKELSAVLDSIPKPDQPEIDVVPYPEIKRFLQELDWTGKPPPAPDVARPEVVEAAPKIPVRDLLLVLVIKVDTVDPKQSLAVVKFVDPKLQSHNLVKEDTILRVGERLFSPFQDVRVEGFTAEKDASGQIVRCAIVFAFDDAAREKETVSASEYESPREIGIVAVGAGGAILPETQKRITARANPEPYNPRKTQLIRKNEYQIGSDTLGELDQDYSRILSRDVEYETYRNPRTGATEGIKINRVAPNSLPAQHGLSEGEILKSINGHKVTSVNDAIAFVKANAESTDTWYAVFEKQGREFTRTYHSPRE